MKMNELVLLKRQITNQIHYNAKLSRMLEQYTYTCPLNIAKLVGLHTVMNLSLRNRISESSSSENLVPPIILSEETTVGGSTANTDGQSKLYRLNAKELKPFPHIPSVRNLKLKLEGDRISEVAVVEGNNKAMNRYVEYNVIRLRKTWKPDVYWRIAWFLMKNSVVFHMAALTRSFPRYYREYPMTFVFKTIHESMDLARSFRLDLQFKRKYIPKQNLKWRPLGIPTPAWRVYLTMLNWFLLEWCKKHQGLIPEWQHAFQPGKGAITAWRSIIADILPKRNIYEFDLQGFFDNVRVDPTLRILEPYGFPYWVAYLLYKLSENAPDLSKLRALEMDESRALRKAMDTERLDKTKLLSEEWINNFCLSPSEVEEQLRALFYYEDKKAREDKLKREAEFGGDWSAELKKMSAYRFDVELMGTQHPWEKESRPYTGFPHDIVGFPQGANTSPLLAILSLSDLKLPKGCGVLMYADDGLVYSETDIDPATLRSAFGRLGIKLAEAKSHVIKEGGIWRRPIKFLGLTYNGSTNTLGSDTRSGTRINLQPHQVRDFLGFNPDKFPWLDPDVLPEECGRVSDLFSDWREINDNLDVNSRWILESDTRSMVFSTREECEAWSKQHPSFSGRIRYIDDDYINAELEKLLAGLREPSWETVVKSKVFAILQSKLFAKTKTDFNERLSKIVNNSWFNERARLFTNLSVSNSGSAAFSDFCEIIRRKRVIETHKRLLSQRLITARAYFCVRRRLGLVYGYDASC